VCADCNTERQQTAAVPAGIAPETLAVEVRDPGVATVAVAVPPQQELNGLGIPSTVPSITLPPVAASRHMTMPQGLHGARVVGVVEIKTELAGAEIVALWLVDHDQMSWAIWFDRVRRVMTAAPLLA